MYDALRDLLLFVQFKIPPWVFFTLFKLYKWYPVPNSAKRHIWLTGTSAVDPQYLKVKVAKKDQQSDQKLYRHQHVKNHLDSSFILEIKPILESYDLSGYVRHFSPLPTEKNYSNNFQFSCICNSMQRNSLFDQFLIEIEQILVP